MFRLFADGFRYKAWADRELLEYGERQWDALPKEDARFFARILNHAHVVDRIFVGHITGQPHGFHADNTVETPSLVALKASMAHTDGWLAEYAASATQEELDREVSFVFTDGDRGRMRVEEILLHLLTHGNIHRGMATRVLAERGLDRPEDTFAHFLHLKQPARRTTAVHP